MLKLRTVLMLGDQILEILEFMHTHFVVHRDIKPGNLVMGTGKNCDKVYLIDFGLATSCALYSPSESNCKKHIFNKKYANFRVFMEQSWKNINFADTS